MIRTALLMEMTYKLTASTTLIGAIAALSLVQSAGCSDGRPSRVPVSGQVLIDGQPLKYGQIQFIPDNARLSGGRLNSEGRFTLSCFDKNDGAVPGLHCISVTAGEFVSPSQTRWHAPKKYASAATSGLTQQIDGPEDNLVINLTWSGGKPFIENHEADSENPTIPPPQP